MEHFSIRMFIALYDDIWFRLPAADANKLFIRKPVAADGQIAFHSPQPQTAHKVHSLGIPAKPHDETKGTTLERAQFLPRIPPERFLGSEATLRRLLPRFVWPARRILSANVRLPPGCRMTSDIARGRFPEGAGTGDRAPRPIDMCDAPPAS